MKSQVVFARDRLNHYGGLFDTDGKPFIDLDSLSKTDKAAMAELMGGEHITQLVSSAETLGTVTKVGQNGIDELFKVKNANVDYVVVEYKYGSSKQAATKDGLQGSDDWIFGGKTGSNRAQQLIDNQIEYDKFVDSFSAGRVEKWLVHTDPHGKVSVAIMGPDGRLVKAPENITKLLRGK